MPEDRIDLLRRQLKDKSEGNEDHRFKMTNGNGHFDET